MDATSIAFGRNYARESDAVWFVARGIVEADLAQGNLIELPVDTKAMQGPVGITVRADVKLNAAAALMAQCVRKAVIILDQRNRAAIATTEKSLFCAFDLLHIGGNGSACRREACS